MIVLILIVSDYMMAFLFVRDSTKIKVHHIRKMIHRELKDLGLKTKLTTNIKQVDFLDVTFDLMNSSYQPYVKTDSNPVYVHHNSNHPKSVIKHIHSSIEFRSVNFSNKEVFNRHREFYNCPE